jgi:hypothetical protein
VDSWTFLSRAVLLSRWRCKTSQCCLVKWLKRDGHKKHHSSADQVFFRIFRSNSFFRIFRKIGLSCLGNYLWGLFRKLRKIDIQLLLPIALCYFEVFETNQELLAHCITIITSFQL